MDEKKESPKIKILVAAVALVTALVALATALVDKGFAAKGEKWLRERNGPSPPSANHPAKNKTAVEVVVRPQFGATEMPVAKLKLVSNGAPLANRQLSVFRLPRNTGDKPLAVRDTDASGTVTLPLPGMQPPDALLIAFGGDESHDASSTELIAK